MSFSIRNMQKAYAGVPVLKGVDLTIEKGEIHALLGANGAGKSTLIKCISGAEQHDSGEMTIEGLVFAPQSPSDAHRAGIAVVYQELSLASGLNVCDNVFLGQELRIGPLVRQRAQRNEVSSWLKQLGVNVDPSTDLVKLSNAELQVVEIVKVLRTSPKLLILDEPTASLTEREARELGVQLLELKKQNLPLLYVTHRLGEVFELADRVSVLRGGKVVLTGLVKDITEQQIVSAIAGRDIVSRKTTQFNFSVSKPLMEVRDLLAPGIGPINLDIHSGEILGVYGLVGSGRTELLETLFGGRKRHAGTVKVNGRPIRLRRPTDAVLAGIALVPEDRHRKSVFQNLVASENMLMAGTTRSGKLGFRSRRAERKSFSVMADRLNLQPRRPDLEARRFSGGNQQKLVLGRWLHDDDCKVLMLDEPTQGVDVGARGDLYSVLDSSAQRGLAVIVASSEPAELLQLAHRVIVLSQGRLAGTLSGAELDEERLLKLAHVGE